MNKDDIR